MNSLNNKMTSGFFAVATAGNRDEILVDSFTSQAPMLSKMQWSKANKTVAHTYREITDIEGVDVFDMDGAMPDMKVSFQLGSVHLTPFGGRMELGEDTARLMGDPDNYFMEQSLLLSRHGGQRLERAFFDKIVSTAVEKNRVFHYDASVAKNSGATIAVVSWSALETCALYSPAFASPQGDFWEVERYHNGNIYPNRDGVNVYGAYVKLMAGLLLANPKSYAVLRNVPLNTDTKEFPKKFADAMAHVVDEANPHDGTTVIMPRAYKVRIASSVSHYGTGNALIQFDNQFNCRICGCEVVGSPNIPLNFRLKNEED